MKKNLKKNMKMKGNKIETTKNNRKG